MFQPDSEHTLEFTRSLQTRIEQHSVCKGYGYVLGKNGDKVMCTCRQEALFQYRLAMSGIPPKFRALGFKDYAYKESDTYRKVQAYLAAAHEHRETGMGLYLYGPSYTGKTLLACSLLTELMKAGYTCRYVSFDMILEQKENWKSLFLGAHFIGLDRVGEILDKLTNSRDGILTGNRIYGAAEFLSQVMAHCVNWNIPLIISSSASLSTVNTTFPSLANLIMGNCKLISCEDKGFRQKRIEQMMMD